MSFILLVFLAGAEGVCAISRSAQAATIVECRVFVCGGENVVFERDWADLGL